MSEKEERDNSAETGLEETASASGISRRSLFRLGLAGAAGAAAIGGAAYVSKKIEGTPHDEFPVPIRGDYKPFDQRDVLFTYAASKELYKKDPARIEKLNGFNFHEKYKGILKGSYGEQPGYTQLDRALTLGAWAALRVVTHGSLSQPNAGYGTWEQNGLAETKYQFKTREEASLAIKSAARVYGAIRCGITKRDPRWDYDPLYDVDKEQTLSWDKDFPFKPKTVIVLLNEMDYETMATAPAHTQDSTVGEAYMQGIKSAFQIAHFLKALGYKAVASMNDLGLNVPYAMAAGLGEGARNGNLITPTYGPRQRLSKVYTDFDFVEYDKPRTFGIASFCKNCKRCADACPSKAITFGDPSFDPTYSNDPDLTWNSSKGVLKFQNDSKLCFKFWIENNGSCGNCIASCPYNKPDHWHHRMVDPLNVLAPGPVHYFMKEMDRVFGYGKVSDVKAVRKLWKMGDQT